MFLFISIIYHLAWSWANDRQGLENGTWNSKTETNWSETRFIWQNTQMCRRENLWHRKAGLTGIYPNWLKRNWQRMRVYDVAHIWLSMMRPMAGSWKPAPAHLTLLHVDNNKFTKNKKSIKWILQKQRKQLLKSSCIHLFCVFKPR